MNIRQTARDLYRLLKPGLGAGILVTIPPGLLLGTQLPSLFLVATTMIGTFLVAIASFVYNQIIEVRTDAIMARTRERPLPAGTLSIFSAYLAASTLLGLGLFTLVMFVNVLAALIAFASFVYYVFIYTAAFKTRTPLNTVFGGVAGAVGPLIGEAAVRNTVGEIGVALFLLLFLWQPAHFWCLGIRYREEYAAAGIPILPVARGVPHTLNQMLLYQFLLVAAMALMCVPLALAGPIFFIPSVGFGLLVLWQMWGLRKKILSGVEASPLRVFFFTIGHMIVWHLAMTADILFTRWI